MGFIKRIIKVIIIMACIVYITDICLKVISVTDENSYYNYDNDFNKETKSNNKIIETTKERNYLDNKYNLYYTFLNDDEKMVYYDIYEGANIYSDQINLSKRIKVSEFSKILQSVLFDHPEIFWVKTGFKYYRDEETDEVYSVILNYIAEKDKIEIMKRDVSLKVDAIVSEAQKFGADYQKERYVHDTLAKIITYDQEMMSDQSLYNALINGRAVCVGYTKAFQLIMTKLNIPTYYLGGEAEERHAWNLVLLDDEYYNVDLTWDDQIERTIYNYYNVTDDFISKDHERIDISLNMPKATGTKYRFRY